MLLTSLLTSWSTKIQIPSHPCRCPNCHGADPGMTGLLPTGMTYMYVAGQAIYELSWRVGRDRNRMVDRV